MQTTADLYVNDLVNDAFAFIRVSSIDMPLSGNDEERGVKVLNEILAEFDARGYKIPFFYDISFSVTADKQKYYIGEGDLADFSNPYFTDTPYVWLLFNQVQYPVNIIKDIENFSTIKYTNTSFLPATARIYFENDTTGNTYTVLDFYYFPDQTYTCYMRGKPRMSQAGIQDTLVQLPMYYRAYLKLELAKRLIPYYGNDEAWNQNCEEQYISAKNIVEAAAESDLSVKTDESLLNHGSYNWTGWLGVN